MRHIFFLHSNICTIVAFETIKELIEREEDVVVILNRGTKFPFFEGKLEVFDIQYITDEYRKLSSNLIGKFLNYRFHYLPKFDVKAKEIIRNRDFILYTPSYNQFTLRAFLNSPHLIGYYYLEEGSISYVSDSILKRKYYYKLFIKGRLLSALLGVKEYYDFKITPKFKGAICISSYTFPWLEKNKIINNIDQYMLTLDNSSLLFDSIIVTDYMLDDINIIYSGFDLIFKHIISNNKRRVAVKFHPSAYSYNKCKCNQVKNYLESKYSNLELIFVPSSYSVEASLYRFKTDLYSIFEMSSLCLYSVIYGSKAYVADLGMPITIEKIDTVDKFLDKAKYVK